jgi:cytochrome o ubiquinol oxidase subunit 1
MGVTRRTQHFDDSSLQPYLTIAAIGVFIIMAGILAFVIQLVVSFFKRERLRDLTGDPWDGRTLEWSTSSPPPPYNFAFTPVVHDYDAWADMKKRGYDRPLGGFKPIHMPKNTAAGIVLAGLSTMLGFALVWYIWWLAALCFIALVAAAIIHTFNYNRDTTVPAEDVARFETRRAAQLAAAEA